MTPGQRVRVIAVNKDGRKWQDYGEEGVVSGREITIPVGKVRPVVLYKDMRTKLVSYFIPEHLEAV